MGSKIAMLLHGDLSAPARREYLPVRRCSGPSSGLQETSAHKPYLPSWLREPDAHFLAKKKQIWLHKSGFKRQQHGAYINCTAWCLRNSRTWLCSPSQPEHLLCPPSVPEASATHCPPMATGPPCGWDCRNLPIRAKATIWSQLSTGT